MNSLPLCSIGWQPILKSCRQLPTAPQSIGRERTGDLRVARCLNYRASLGLRTGSVKLRGWQACVIPHTGPTGTPLHTHATNGMFPTRGKQPVSPRTCLRSPQKGTQVRGFSFFPDPSPASTASMLISVCTIVGSLCGTISSEFSMFVFVLRLPESSFCCSLRAPSARTALSVVLFTIRIPRYLSRSVQLAVLL